MNKTVYLELPFMPENCLECVLSTKKEYDNGVFWVCAAFETKEYVDLMNEQRPTFCPLKVMNANGETHRAIVKNFNPDDAETDRVLQEATNRTIEKYREE